MSYPSAVPRCSSSDELDAGAARAVRHCLLRWGATLLVAVALGACGGEVPSRYATALVDSMASDRTRALYARLHTVTDETVLFGHQDDLAYGVHWFAEDGRSDVEAVTGSYPAVYGWDVGDLGNPGATVNLDSVSFDRMREWIIEGYNRGGVVTISWHMDNPVSGGSSWDTTQAVPQILPGGTHHDSLRAKLDRFAAFAKSLETGFWSWIGLGHRVPVLFRPYHEMTGSWFWWGGDNVTPEHYKQLWRFTVEYLRDEKDVHNLLYAYSPDVFRTPQEYMEHYPGDAYVDVMGYDDYHSLTVGYGSPPGGASSPADSARMDPARADSMAAALLAASLRTVVRQANAHGKVPAFTETGFEGIPDSTWWTDRLLRALNTDSLTRQTAYVLVWRNAYEERNPGHHFAPYPGHPSADSFVRFYEHPLIHFEDELPDMYEFGPID